MKILMTKTTLQAYRRIICRATLLLALLTAITVSSARLRADVDTTGSCGGSSLTIPFTDVPGSNVFFCSIASAYFSGLTNGTTATTYGPQVNVNREQMAAFITRTLDQTLRRGSRRAVAQQWWTPRSILNSVDLGSGGGPMAIAYDGADLWVANSTSNSVSRVRASDGKLLQTWLTGGSAVIDIIVAAGRIFILGNNQTLYVIHPSLPPGALQVFTGNLPIGATEITFDGVNLWTANLGSVSRINLATGAVTTFSAGFVEPDDILWDGANLWVTDVTADKLLRIDPSNGGVLEAITIENPENLLFDGINLWVSQFTFSSDITVVRAVGNLRGVIIAKLKANPDISAPDEMAFDGERVLVCDGAPGFHSVSLFKASDFTPLGSVEIGDTGSAVCSDGLNFWVTRFNSGDLVRF